MEKKKSISEQGHARNVANFRKLREIATAFPGYAPSNPSLSPNALLATEAAAQGALDSVAQSLAAYKLQVDARQTAFGPVSRFLTRISRAVKATDGTTKEHIATFNSLARKYRGSRKAAKESGVAQPSATGDLAPDQSSVAQLSFDSRVANFGNILALVEGLPQYAPNEPELAVAGLTQTAQALRQANTEVLRTAVLLGSGRILRNKALYAADTGLVDTALKLKDYVASKWGLGSAEWKAVSKIAFARIQP